MNNNGATPDRKLPPMNFGGRGGRGGRGGGPMGARVNVEKPKNLMKSFGRLLKYIGKSRMLIACLILFMVLITFCELAGPALQGAAIDTISIVDGKLRVDFAQMAVYLVIMAVMFAFAALLHYFQAIVAAKLSQNTVYTLRNDLFAKISKLPIKYTDRHSHGDIMSRMTNDVENVSNAVSSSISSLISSVMTLVGAFSLMLYYNWIIALVACVTIPVTVIVSGIKAANSRLS